MVSARYSLVVFKLYVDVQLNAVVSSFGKYIKCSVKINDEPSASSPPVERLNAFTILMAHRTLPPCIEPARYNSLM